MTKYWIRCEKNPKRGKKNYPTDKTQLLSNGYHDQTIYINKTELLRGKLQDGDTIEIHGHGSPWVYGQEAPNDDIDLTASALAEKLSAVLPLGMACTIDLLTCYSGTKGVGSDNTETLKRPEICFARDLSRELSKLGYRNITVYGYDAVIHNQKLFKPSAVGGKGDESDAKHRASQGHCKLEDARVVYLNGNLIQDAEKRLVGRFPYARKDIIADQNLRDCLEKIAEAKEAAAVVIQALCRGGHQRRGTPKADRAAVVIQALSRGSNQRRVTKENQAAVGEKSQAPGSEEQPALSPRI